MDEFDIPVKSLERIQQLVRRSGSVEVPTCRIRNGSRTGSSGPATFSRSYPLGITLIFDGHAG